MDDVGDEAKGLLRLSDDLKGLGQMKMLQWQQSLRPPVVLERQRTGDSKH